MSAESVMGGEAGLTLEVASPVLGEYVLDAADPTERTVSGMLLGTPLGRRSLGISQLSTTEAWEIIPGTSRFTRFAHMADLGRLIIDTGRSQQLPEEDIRGLFRQCAVGDAAHGPFAHVADMVVEGVGASESFHDGREQEALMHGDAWGWLRGQTSHQTWWRLKYGEGVPPWCESPAPGVCTDRLQYNSYEGALWYEGVPGQAATQVREALGAPQLTDQLTVDDDGHYVFADADIASIFAKQSLLHGTEHWAHPAKRLQQFLLVGAIQRAIVAGKLARIGQITYDWDGSCNPYDALYALDSDVTDAMVQGDDYLAQAGALIAAVGVEGRQRFSENVQAYAAFVADQTASAYPDGPRLTQSGIIQEAHTPSPYTVQLAAPKYRTVDPLVATRRGALPLSEVRPVYGTVRESHRATQSRSYQIAGLQYDGMPYEDPSSCLGYFVYYTHLAGGDFRYRLERANFRPHEGLGTYIREAGRLAMRQAVQRGQLTTKDGRFRFQP